MVCVVVVAFISQMNRQLAGARRLGKSKERQEKGLGARLLFMYIISMYVAGKNVSVEHSGRPPPTLTKATL